MISGVFGLRPRTSEGAEVFTPMSRNGAYPLLAVAAISGILGLILLVRAMTLGVSFAAFLAILAAVLLLAGGAITGYLGWAALTLRYEVGRGLLTIHWGLSRYETPVARFSRVVRGRANAAPRVQGLDLPNLHIGRMHLPRVGTMRVYSLHASPSELLYLIGDGVALAISVGDAAGFVRVLQQQRELLEPTVESRDISHPWFAVLSWRDLPVQAALIASLALALLVTAVIFSRYAGFPDEIVLNFPDADTVGSRGTLLRIPLLAWLVVIGNGAAGIWLLRERRATAYSLLWGAVFVNALLLAGAVTAA